MSTVKIIPSETTFSVRNPVLRPHQPVESCRFDGDNLASTTHFGCYEEEKLIGVVALFEKPNLNWALDKQYQLRGMAVLDDHQKKGIGEQLVKTVITFAQEKKMQLIWFNARKNAVPFYEKLNFHRYGTAFEIEGIGTHYLMYRLLQGIKK